MKKRPLTLALLGLLLIPVLAFRFGGWAVVSVDDLPEYLVAGKPVAVSFKVRQHAVSLLDGLKPTITLTSGNTETTIPAGGDANAIAHIGFFVTQPKEYLAKWRAAGFRVDFNDPKIGDHGYIYTPEGLRIEIQENHILKDEGKTQTLPIVSDHVHFNGPAGYDKEAQAWYHERFGGTLVMQNEDVIPGMRLRWAIAKTTKPLLPTKGQTLDHVGFEIKGLEAFCKKLQASGVKFDQPYNMTRHKSFASATFTDPWGVSIEVTEGLSGL